MLTQESDYKYPKQAREEAGWTFLLDTLGMHDKAGQASDEAPVIKSVDQTMPKPEVNKIVEQALRSNPHIESSLIRVLSQGSKIILSGKVRSWFQKEEAGKVAKQASGNLNIINDIAISYSL